MQTLVESWLRDLGLDEDGNWHAAPAMDHWRWTFADLPGETIKSTVAEVIMRVLVGADPSTFSPEELHYLNMSGFGRPAKRSRRSR